MPPRAVVPKVQVNFPVKHHHGMNSAVLPCCLWKCRNPNQTTPRQAQHALKHRGEHKLWQKAGSVTESSPPLPRVPPGWGTASPGVAPGTGAPARGTGRANCNGIDSSETAPLPHLTQVPPQSHSELKHMKRNPFCVCPRLLQFLLQLN